MEPAAILSLVSACLGVTKGTINAVHGLYGAQQLYGNATLVLQAIETQLSTLDFTLTRLQIWVEQAAGFRTVDPEFVEKLSVSIQGCLGVMSAVRAKIEYKEDFGRMEKARFVWNESSISTLAGVLGNQLQALQVLLQYSQITDISQQRGRMQAAETKFTLLAARATASVYESSLDTIDTELAERRFAFDDEIVNSHVYRAAFRQQTARRVREGELEKELASLKEADGAGGEQTVGSQHKQKDGEDGRINMKPHYIEKDGKDLESSSSMIDLADTYHKQGRWEEAEKLDVQVMETRKRVLGEEHPKTLGSIYNLALTYYRQNRWVEAEELLTHVVEKSKRVLGEEDLDTSDSMALLVATYCHQRRLLEAKKLQVQVIEKRKRVLGQEHPKTLRSMCMQAVTLKKLGRQDDALSLLAECHKKQQRVLGSSHPDFLRTDKYLKEWSPSQ